MSWDTERTKRLLLDAAREEFAEYGITGARVNRIADRAGVNKERIYAYFGNKEQLFGHVMMRVMTEIAADVRPGEGPIADYVGRIFDYHRGDRTMLRLLMFEALHYGDSLVSEDSPRVRWYREASATLSRDHGFSEEQSQRVLSTLIGLAAWPFAMPQLTSLCNNGEQSDEKVLDELRDFITGLAERGLSAEPSVQ